MKTPIATFLGIQPGYGTLPDVELWNLLEDIPGHGNGSTVSRETIEKAGHRLPQPHQVCNDVEGASEDAGLIDP